MKPHHFAGLRVASFESRRADDIERMIARFGGVPFVSPSMREVAIGHNQRGHRFCESAHHGRDRRRDFHDRRRHADLGRSKSSGMSIGPGFLAAVSDVKSVVRGPKPLAVLKELGITPTIMVPEPNTWREILGTLDEKLPVANLVVGLQEYGITNRSLIAGLEARGATVDSIHVYDWALPEDCGPLEQNIRRIAAGEIDVAMFTSGNQVFNLLKLADELGLADEVRAGFRNIVVASIGPTTSEMLRNEDLPVDMEPSHPKMGHLVNEAAERAGEFSLASDDASVSNCRLRIADCGMPNEIRNPKSAIRNSDPALHDSPFMRACRREPTEYTPDLADAASGPIHARVSSHSRSSIVFWSCAAIRSCAARSCAWRSSSLASMRRSCFPTCCRSSSRWAWIWNSRKGEGPLIHNPVRESADVDRVIELESADALHFVMEAVRQTRADLPANIPLIGFAGAPFTLAATRSKAARSRDFLHTKTLMYRDRGAWDALMGRLARAVIVYLNAQIAAGAQAVQLFDSWAGTLGPDDYRQYVLPFVQTDRGRHHARRAGHQFRHRQSAADAVVGRRRRDV